MEEQWLIQPNHREDDSSRQLSDVLNSIQGLSCAVSMDMVLAPIVVRLIVPSGIEEMVIACQKLEGPQYNEGNDVGGVLPLKENPHLLADPRPLEAAAAEDDRVDTYHNIGR